MERKLKDGIEVVIMCRERQNETLRAIGAIKHVDFGVDTQIIVSDNASKPEKALTGLPSGIIHRLRDPSGSWNWHFNTIVSELGYEWCLITHDDDEILPILGTIFQSHKDNPEVSVITGLSQIIDHEAGLISNNGYEFRLNSAGIREQAGVIHLDLSQKLFDFGTLFPASAIIIRSSLLKSVAPLDTRFEWTADFGLSILIAHRKGVIFEGIKPVMNYHLHGNNSVFTDEAAGGIKSDLTVTRILMLDKFPELYNASRMNMLLKSVIKSRILLSAFGLNERKIILNETINSSLILRRGSLKYFLMKIPIYLGPLSGFVRRKMRKRIGI